MPTGEELDCACVVGRDSSGPRIIYCAVHKAAFTMLAALERLDEEIEDISGNADACVFCGDASGDSHSKGCPITQARAAYRHLAAMLQAQPDVEPRKPPETRSIPPLTVPDAILKCPICQSIKFQCGPRANLAQNLRCENGHYWNLTPFGLDPIKVPDASS